MKTISLIGERVVLLAWFLSLAGCSAMLASVGTEEDEVVYRGISLPELTAKLGPPQSIKEFDQPLTYDGLLDRVDLPITIRPVLPDSYPSSTSGAADGELLMSEVRYSFSGKLKGEHDAGEAVAVNLMTLGTGEVVMLPKLIAEKSRDHHYTLVVWTDIADIVRFYQWRKGDVAKR